jgi:hypothetical protein
VAEYLCPRANCNRPSLVFFRASYGNYGYALESAAKSIPSGTATAIDDLPPEIGRDRDEAWASYFSGNMGRAALQRAVRTLRAGAPV